MSDNVDYANTNLEQENIINYRPLPTKRGFSLLLSIFILFGVCFIFTIFIGNILFTPLTVVGVSMQPNLNSKVNTSSEDEKNDVVYIANCNDFDYGDVVVFNNPTDEKYLVKRVVGKPGDIISYKIINNKIIDGQNYIYYNIVRNGEILLENYINEEMYVNTAETFSYQFYQSLIRNTQQTLAEDEYFCLGDNRNNSYDCRYFGAIHKSAIIGKVYFVNHYGDSLFTGLIKRIFEGAI